MNFREWINQFNQDQDNIDHLLWPIISPIKDFIINSVKLNGNVVEIRFPKQSQQILQVAHYNPVEEGYNDQHPYGKAGLAFKAIDNSKFAQTMNPNDAINFQKGFKKSIEKISKYMGSLFELELFLYLADDKKMRIKGSLGKNWALSKIQIANESILHAVGQKLSVQVRGFINHHVEDMGAKIYQKALSLLDCKVDTVIFSGGDYEDRGFITKHLIRNTADITLSCSGSNMKRSDIGFSTKFTSETSVAVANLFPRQAYALTGGKDSRGFQDNFDQAEGREKDVVVLSAIEDNLNKLIQSPSKITKLVNYLLFGSERIDGPGSEERTADVLPAVRNYVKNRGGPEFGSTIKGDFRTSEEPGDKVRVKKNSEFDIRRTSTEVILTIRGPESRGTMLKFKSFGGAIKVFMNNLA